MSKYDVWYSEGSQKKLLQVDARSPEEAKDLGEAILAQKREIVSIKKLSDVHREPSSTPYPEFLPDYEAN